MGVRTLFTLNEIKQWRGRVPRSVGDPRQGAERGGDGRALRFFHLDRKTVRRLGNLLIDSRRRAAI